MCPDRSKRNNGGGGAILESTDRLRFRNSKFRVILPIFLDVGRRTYTAW